MNRIPLLLVLLGAMPALVADDAADAYQRNLEQVRRNVGIGLGTMVWAHAGSGLVCQVSAATTNGTYGNQTFAVTTGTSEADSWSRIAQRPAIRDFVGDNLDLLVRDLATGQGESLSALAELAGIPEGRRPAWAAGLRSRFREILPRPDTTTDEVLTAIGRSPG